MNCTAADNKIARNEHVIDDLMVGILFSCSALLSPVLASKQEKGAKGEEGGRGLVRRKSITIVDPNGLWIDVVKDTTEPGYYLLGSPAALTRATGFHSDKNSSISTLSISSHSICFGVMCAHGTKKEPRPQKYPLRHHGRLAISIVRTEMFCRLFRANVVKGFLCDKWLIYCLCLCGICLVLFLCYLFEFLWPIHLFERTLACVPAAIHTQAPGPAHTHSALFVLIH